MRKIPTLFVRDKEDPSRVTEEVTPGCEWVLKGEGVPTRKYDGTCCMVRDTKLYKRREVKKPKSEHEAQSFENKLIAMEFEQVDDLPNKVIGWVPVGDGPEDKWHREAIGRFLGRGQSADGTYELVGPRVQGGAESSFVMHDLVKHGAVLYGTEDLTTMNLTTFSEIRHSLKSMDAEGIVWHHADGRMAKIKRRDFGFPWPIKEDA